MRTKHACAFFVLFLIPSVALSADSILVEEFDFAAAKDNPSKFAAQYLSEKITGNPIFKERKKLIPVYFTVTFQEEAQTAVGGRGLVGAVSGGEAKNSIWVAKLKGLTPELRQKIATDLLADFVADLNQRGFNAATPEQLAAMEPFQAVVKASAGNFGGADQIRTEKDNNVYWHVVPKGMPIMESGFSKHINASKNIRTLMVDTGKSSALMVALAINIVKLTGVGSADGSRSATNDLVFGLALPVSTNDGQLGFTMQMFQYNPEHEHYGEKHFAVYNTQYAHMLHVNASKALETAATPIGEGKFVKDNKGAGALALGLALLGGSAKAVPKIEYDIAIDADRYSETVRKLVGAARTMAFESAKDKRF